MILLFNKGYCKEDKQGGYESKIFNIAFNRYLCRSLILICR